MNDITKEKWLSNNLPEVITIFLAIFTALCFSLLGPKKFLILSIGTGILIYSLIKPLFGLNILAFSIPLAGILKIAPKLTANKIFALWVLISFIFGSLSKKKQISILSSNAINTYFLLHLWILLMFPLSYVTVEDIRNLVGRIFLLGLVFLITAIPQDFKQFQLFCLATAAGSAFLGIYSVIFGMGELVGKYGTRLAAGTNENVLAHSLGVGLFLSFFALRKSNKLVKSTILILDFFTIYAILLTGSRGTWLALILSVALFPLFAPNVPLRKRLNYFSLGILATFIVSWGLINRYFGQLGQLVMDRVHEHDSITQAAGGRIDYIWPYYLNKFIQKPVSGWGLGFTYNVHLSPHNDLLYILIETGAIGLVLFLLFHFFVLKNIFKEKDTTLRLQSFMLLVFIFFSGLTHSTITLKSYALAIGSLCFLAKRCNKEIHNSLINSEFESL